MIGNKIDGGSSCIRSNSDKQYEYSIKKMCETPIQVIEITMTTSQLIVGMGCSVYCRTCAAPPCDLADGMIDIFANTKITALLSTIKEWQLDITQDDGLSQCICKKCELALIKINTFRLQALRAKNVLQTRLHSLDTTAGNGEAIDDNENDLHTETNYGGVEMHNREALSRTLQSEYTSIQMCKKPFNIFNANEKVSEKEQSNNFESGLNAVVEEAGELSFDSNIESSRPLEFQVILIEEEEESTQWINEDENAVEKRIQPFAMGIIGCEELNTGNKSTSGEGTGIHPINCQSFSKPSKNISTDFIPNENKLRNKKQSQKGKYYEIKSNKFSKVSSLVENNSPVTQFHLVNKETIKGIRPLYERVSNNTLEDPGQISDIQTLLTTISSGSFESIKESSTCSADDLQSVLMNQLTLQMINANVNILEEDLQIVDFETLLAAVDEQSSLGSINNSKEQYPSLLKNGENVLKVNNENWKGTPAPNIGKNFLTAAASHIEKETKGFLTEMNEKAVPLQTITRDLESKFTNHTTNGPSNKLACNKDLIDNAIVKNQKLNVKDAPIVLGRSSKITSRSMRCRLCVCKVSDQPIFATKQILDDHIASVHDDKERPYNCPQCTARYRTRSGCVAHINAIHLKKGDKCELCDKIVIGGAGQMRMHIERNHTHGNYTCEICSIELKNISLYNFNYHKRWHNEDKLWRCEVCGKAFVTRTHLIEHKVTHTRQGEFLCTRCGKSKQILHSLYIRMYMHMPLNPST